MKTWKPWSKQLLEEQLKFSFCEQNADLVKVLTETFAKVDEVEVLQGDIKVIS